MKENHIDWQKIHHIHFVGIKGVAMTALAVWAKEKGYEVSGSDIAEEFPTDEVLLAANIFPLVDFSPQHVQGDLLVYTGAHGGRENIEVITGINKGIPVLSHGKALGEVMKGYRQLSIAGCHGKTTTTAMIATILTHAGLDPSYAIGSGVVRGLGLPGHSGKGEWFIAEADEYVTDPGHDMTPRFLWQNPEVLVITAIDFDHPDVYKDIDAVGNAYVSLVNNVKEEGALIFNSSDKNSLKFLQDKKTYGTYGFINADIVVVKKEQQPFLNSGIFQIDNEEILITLKVPGMHNLLNAAGSFLTAKKAGIDTKAIVEGLEKFEGAARRFEYVGEYKGTPVIDDYAHHPAEIAATLGAAREWYPDSHIIALFQPHTYSRTKALLPAFSHAFASCDEVGIVPIYASARETEKTIDEKEVVNELSKHHSNVSFYPSVQSFFEFYSTKRMKNDIILCLGAGDIGRNVRKWIL